MFLIIVGILLITGAYSLFYLTYMFPILRIAYFDWIATILFIAPWIVTMYRLWITKSYLQADRLSPWKHLINYMRRDNEIIPITGTRAFPGESFLDVPQLGLIEYVGKDCVYQWRDKKVVWGLENLNFTPDPRYFNLCHLFWKLGFSDSDDIQNVLDGKDLEMMGRVYLNMLKYDGSRGAKKLINEVKEYEGPVVEFKPSEEKPIRERMNDFFERKKQWT